jgi:hypothetical protein
LPVAQRQAKGQHQILLALAARLRAVVDAAMAGIDDDDRAAIGLLPGFRVGRCGNRRGRRIGNSRPQLRTVFRSQRRHEGGALDLLHFEHQPRRLAVGSLHHVGIGDLGRARQVEHDSGAAGHHQPIAEGLDQSASAGPGPGGKLKIDLGNVNHHPIRVGQSDCAEANGLIDVEDKASLPAVPGQSGGPGRWEIR